VRAAIFALAALEMRWEVLAVRRAAAGVGVHADATAAAGVRNFEAAYGENFVEA